MKWYSLPLLFSIVRSCEHSIGTRVRAAVVDTIMMMDTIQPSCLNMMPAMPEIIVSGRNTHSIVRVEAMTEIPTSAVPWTAASLGFSPRSRCVVTFSRTTMASSTTMPMAMDRADIEMMFRVLPVAKRYISEARRAIGMDRTTIRVPFHRPRKMYTMSITTRNVMRIVSFRELMVRRMLSEESTTGVILMSDGRLRWSLASSFLTPRITFTVL